MALSDFLCNILLSYFSYKFVLYNMILINLINYIPQQNNKQFIMGNKPNNLIQCGFDDKQIRGQAYNTREEAIKENKSDLSVLDKNSKIFSNSRNSLHSSKLTPTSKSRTPQMFSSIKNQSIPEHENLTKVSRSPLPDYIKRNSINNIFQKQYAKCLDQIIQSRYNTSMHFPEAQIISLLQALVYSLAYVIRKRYPHHDYYPTNIFYENGLFMVKNPRALECSGYSITQQRKRFSFLSPELILEILEDTRQEDIPEEVMEKADVFAIGMIMLQFCTLEPSSECYDPQTYSIIDSVIEQRVHKCTGIYNPLISDCIDLMLQYQVGKRIPSQQLAYVVHNKISELQINQANEMSRVINQNSRLSMSARIPQNPNIQPNLMPYPPNQVNKLPRHITQLPPPYPQNHQQQFVTASSPYQLPPIVNQPPQFSTSPQRILSPRTAVKLKPFQQIEEEDNQHEQSPSVNKNSQSLRQENFEAAKKFEQPGYLSPKTNNTMSKQDIYRGEAKEESLDQRVRRILEDSKKYN